ncbi:hypothetical protein J4Q44_G00085340 [Coregonus suidteri]|uniref:Uncharacterized protein n=1 Tax=Coregonus suidteri TaxID=861788 RepID=A0AAN8R362_9TELE
MSDKSANVQLSKALNPHLLQGCHTMTVKQHILLSGVASQSDFCSLKSLLAECCGERTMCCLVHSAVRCIHIVNEGRPIPAAQSLTSDLIIHPDNGHRAREGWKQRRVGVH